MKTKILAFVMFIAMGLNAFAQFPIDKKTSKVKYTDVIQLEGMTKSEIYEKAKLWIVSTLKSGDNMIAVEGSDEIVGTGNVLIDSIYFITPKFQVKEPILNFKFVVFVKDGRLKYSVENLLFAIPSLSYNSAPPNIELLKTVKRKYRDDWIPHSTRQINKTVFSIISDFKNHMLLDNSNDDW